MEKGKIKRRKSLGKQIIFRLVLICIVATAMNGIMINISCRMEYFLRQEASVRKNTGYLKEYMTDYRSMEWLADYWLEHSEEVGKKAASIGYESEEYLTEEKRLTELTEYAGLWYVTQEEAEQLSEEDQEIFATICYLDISSVFDRIMRTYDPIYLYAIRVEPKGENYESQFLCCGVEENQKRRAEGGDIFDIGTIYEWSGTDYETLAQLADGEKVSEPWDTLARGDEQSHYLVYEPVYFDGKLSYVICMQMENKQIFRQITGKIVVIEIISALIFLSSIWSIYVVLRKRVIRPIRSLQDGVRAFAGDKDAERTASLLSKVKESNEIGVLKEDIVSLAVEMVRYTEEVENLAVEKERRDAELNVATTIQLNMLPSNFEEFTAGENYDVHAMMIPAKEVGGDFYDFFRIDEDHVGLVVADVSGKGVPAALFMAIAKALIKQNLCISPDPAEVLRRVNNQLCENNEESLFVTAWVGVYEVSTGILRAANAGHEYPAISRGGGAYEMIEDDHGLYLGALEDMEYSNYELKLEKGDTLYLYTDGVPEATDADNRLFDMERMLAALNLYQTSELSGLLQGVKKEIDNFVKDAPQFDDITMMAFRIKE